MSRERQGLGLAAFPAYARINKHKFNVVLCLYAVYNVTQRKQTTAAGECHYHSPTCICESTTYAIASATPHCLLYGIGHGRSIANGTVYDGMHSVFLFRGKFPGGVYSLPGAYRREHMN